MNQASYSKQLHFQEPDFPLKSATLNLDVEFSIDVPRAAQQRLIQEILSRASKDVQLSAQPTRPAKEAEPATDWSAPEGMDLRRVKSAHRFLVAAASLQERGPAPTLAEIAEKARLSMPPVYRLIDPEDESGAYIQPLIKTRKQGRAYVVDLTPLGRRVASKIRAGALPS